MPVMLPCSVPGCSDNAIYRTRRLCKRHYWQVRKSGVVPKRPTMAEAFWSLVSPEPNTGCWLWMGRVDKNGYGIFGNGTRRASRVAWELVNERPMPPGLEACHSCDTPGCVRAEISGRGHIFAGTRLMNEQDKSAKGRRPRGEASASAKVSEIQVLEIRKAYASGERQRDIAARFGIGHASIHYIVTGKHWSHLPL